MFILLSAINAWKKERDVVKIQRHHTARKMEEQSWKSSKKSLLILCCFTFMLCLHFPTYLETCVCGHKKRTNITSLSKGPIEIQYSQVSPAWRSLISSDRTKHIMLGTSNNKKLCTIPIQIGFKEPQHVYILIVGVESCSGKLIRNIHKEHKEWPLGKKKQNLNTMESSYVSIEHETNTYFFS